jgi:hypothetical protein
LLTLHEAHRTRRRMLGEQKLKEQLIRLVEICERRSACG